MANQPTAAAEIETQITTGQSAPAKPSSVYNARLWRMGLAAAAALPPRLLRTVAGSASAIYAKANPARREIVVNNLLPVLGSRQQAEQAATKMFRNLGAKVADVLRCEAGKPASAMLAELVNADHVVATQARGQGTLVVTPHLGNWEFGGYILAERGIKLHVVTLVEPGEGLTELRRSCRARSGIETIVIGEDPFAIVEVIKRLEEGGTMALLIDRPPKSVATTVELFGKPFVAAIAAAELARATGCVIAPVIIPRVKDGYRVELLQPIGYDRAALNDRGARQQLTQTIMRAFEPSIRKYADQWYHFVPIWPES
ncbi:MAG: lysophospholipid acyltransferase family protein [Limisphaerales bacterium]